MPLERDEGEFAYSAQLMLEGEPPYAGAYNQKLPGVTMAYAAIMGFLGQTTTAIHIGTLLMNGLTILILFALTRALWDDRAAVIAAAAYAVLTLDQHGLGIAAHSEHFVVLPAVGGLWLLLKGIARGRFGVIAGSGVLLGVATLMKQSGVVFTAFAVLWIVLVERQRGRTQPSRMRTSVLALLTGAALPIAAVATYLFFSGVFARFWFWTFRFATEYGTWVHMEDALSGLGGGIAEVVRSTYPLWIFALAATLLVKRDQQPPGPRAFTLLLFAFSFAGTSFGFLYRQHYFILVMPAIAIMAGAGTTAAIERLRPRPRAAWVPATIFVGACVLSVASEREFLFAMTPEQASRSTYGLNPFVEAQQVGAYLADRTRPGDRIAVLGSEAEILFYARRPSATGYIFTYGLMQAGPTAHDMQREMAAEIEAGRPEYLVFVNVPTSWAGSRVSDPWILDWFARYSANFDQVGLVELSGQGNHIRWDDAARGAVPQTQFFLTVLKRKRITSP